VDLKSQIWFTPGFILHSGTIVQNLVHILLSGCCYVSPAVHFFHPRIVSNQGAVNCLDRWTCIRKWNVHVWGEVRGLPLGSVPPDSCLCRAVGIQRTRRQPRGGQPLHILDALLLGLATSRVNTMHFEIIALIHFPSVRNLHVYMSLLLFLENKSL
jgi:hypothetical protein